MFYIPTYVHMLRKLRTVPPVMNERLTARPREDPAGHEFIIARLGISFRMVLQGYLHYGTGIGDWR